MEVSERDAPSYSQKEPKDLLGVSEWNMSADSDVKPSQQPASLSMLTSNHARDAMQRNRAIAVAHFAIVCV